MPSMPTIGERKTIMAAHTPARGRLDAARVTQHQNRQSEKVRAMDGGGGGMPSEREREQKQHLHAEREIAVHVCSEAVEAVFAEESIDEPEVVSLPIGTGFGREAVRKIEQRVEDEGRGEQNLPKSRQSRKTAIGPRAETPVQRECGNSEREENRRARGMDRTEEENGEAEKCAAGDKGEQVVFHSVESDAQAAKQQPAHRPHHRNGERSAEEDRKGVRHENQLTRSRHVCGVRPQSAPPTRTARRRCPWRGRLRHRQGCRR